MGPVSAKATSYPHLSATVTFFLLLHNLLARPPTILQLPFTTEIFLFLTNNSRWVPERKRRRGRSARGRLAMAWPMSKPREKISTGMLHRAPGLLKCTC